MAGAAAGAHEEEGSRLHQGTQGESCALATAANNRQGGSPLPRILQAGSRAGAIGLPCPCLWPHHARPQRCRTARLWPAAAAHLPEPAVQLLLHRLQEELADDLRGPVLVLVAVLLCRPGGTGGGGRSGCQQTALDTASCPTLPALKTMPLRGRAATVLEQRRRPHDAGWHENNLGRQRRPQTAAPLDEAAARATEALRRWPCGHTHVRWPSPAFPGPTPPCRHPHHPCHACTGADGGRVVGERRLWGAGGPGRSLPGAHTAWTPAAAQKHARTLAPDTSTCTGSATRGSVAASPSAPRHRGAAAAGWPCRGAPVGEQVCLLGLALHRQVVRELALEALGALAVPVELAHNGLGVDAWGPGKGRGPRQAG